MDTGPSSAASMPSGTESLLRRRPVPVHHDWQAGSSEGVDCGQADEGVVFEEDEPTKFQEYSAIFFDYVFWTLLAYCVVNLLLWSGETLGVISPRFEEWNPTRWWHSDPQGLQKELFDNATAAASTATQFKDLKSWIESAPGGWVSPKLVVHDYLSEQSRYDRRLEVLEDVDKDEILVKLPLSHVLSADFCQHDSSDSLIHEVVAAQKKSSQPIELAPWTWITLYIIASSRKSGAQGLSSRWHLGSEYVDASLSYMPIFWDDDSLHWLNGTDLLNVHMLDVHAAIESEYHKISYLVSSIVSAIPVIEFKKWAMVVMSRAETVDLPDRVNTSRIAPQLAIMPLIDLVDHHLPMPEHPLNTDEDLQRYQQHGSRTNITYSSEFGGAVVLRAREVLFARAAVTSGYGVRSNADYLLYHGFTMPREWSDLTLCTHYAMIELPVPTDMPGWKSRFLPHPYRFAVPACPNRKSTPHIFIGAARFLVATEQDLLGFEERLLKDPSLLENNLASKDEKFLHHGAKEALGVVCDTKAAPPVCRSVLSVENELAAWELAQKHTLARVAQHTASVPEDDRLLREDDESGSLSVNQRHAVIVRREEKLTLRRWCAVVVSIVSLLNAVDLEECAMTRVHDTIVLENEEPRLRPRYWSQLEEPGHEGAIPAVCEPR